MSLFKDYSKTFECQSCGHIFWNWQVDEDFIKNYYDNYRNTQKPIPTKSRIKWSSNIVKYLFSLNLPFENLKYLEIGAFDGIFAKHFINKFPIADIFLNEIDSNSCAKYLGDFENVFNCDFLDINGQYDILLAIDVLEHFPNLELVLEKIKQLDIEYLIFQVPYKRPVAKNIDSRDFHPHYHMFSKKSIEKLFSKTYDLIHWKKTRHDFSAKGPEQICVFKKRVTTCTVKI